MTVCGARFGGGDPIETEARLKKERVKDFPVKWESLP